MSKIVPEEYRNSYDDSEYDLTPNEAISYAMKMGFTDSYRGLKQLYANNRSNEEIIETLSNKDKKLKKIFENPKYGDKAFMGFMGGVVLDPVAMGSYAGWAKKAKTLRQAVTHGAGLNAAVGGMAYVGEGENRGVNVAAGATIGGVVGGIAGKAVNTIAKNKNKQALMPSLKDRKQILIEENALLTKEGVNLTPDDINSLTKQAVDEVQGTKVRGKYTQPLQSFYTDTIGDKVWDKAVQNWGSSLVGVASGVAGVNAFTDEESTQLQKLGYGLVATLVGAGGTKALGKIPVKGDETLGDLLARGLIDNYGLPKKYTEIKQQSLGDVNTLSSKFIEIVKQTQTLTPEQNKVLYGMMTGDIAKLPELVNFDIKARDIVKKVGQEMVDVGLLDEKIFNKNQEVYLHRSYLKHHVKGTPTKEGLEAYKAARQFKIIGDELRPRGQKLTKEITTSTYERSFNPKSKTFGIYDNYEASPLRIAVTKAQWEKASKSKNKKINNTVSNIDDWSIVEKDNSAYFLESKNKLLLRGDYDKQTRIDMGEIEDASFAIAETGRLMTNDLAVYKLYANIATEESLSLSQKNFDFKLVQQQVNPNDWVLVPDATLSGVASVSKATPYKFGNLAGRYVHKEVYNDLTKLQQLRESSNSIEKGYLAINRLWKKTKTAWNPTVHTNNTMSNVILYDLADASYKFLPRGFKELSLGLEGKGKSPMYDLAESFGVFDVDMVSKELTNEVNSILSKSLENLANKTSPEVINAQKYSYQTFKGLAKKGYEMTAKKLEDIYQLEDQAFRMGLFMDRINKGMSPAEAAADAKKWFINYDINAPIINTMRRYPTPFLSYTYRVTPLLAEAAIKRPWKYAKWATGAYVLNEAGKELGSGNEERERVLMRENLKVGMFGMPFMPSTSIKTPFTSKREGLAGDKVPLYMDVKRFIPGGDVFALDEDKGIGIPIPFTGGEKSLKLPSTLTPSFGALGETLIPLMTRVDPFTMRQIEGIGLGKDDAVIMQHIISRLTPNIPSTAFTMPLFGESLNNYDPFSSTFSSKKIKEAFRQTTSGKSAQYATSYTPFEAIISAFGFKLTPMDMTKLSGIQDAEFRRKYAKAKKEISFITKQLEQDRIKLPEAEEKVKDIYDRMIELEQDYSNLRERERETMVEGGLVKGSVDVPDTKENPADRVDPNTGKPYSERARESFENGGLAESKLKEIDRIFHGGTREEKEVKSDLDILLNSHWLRMKDENPKYKNVSFKDYKNYANQFNNHVVIMESNDKNANYNKAGSSARGYHQWMPESLEPAVNRTVKYVPNFEHAEDIIRNKDIVKHNKETQNLLFHANFLESKGSDKYGVDAYMSGNKKAMRDGYLQIHHTMSGSEYQTNKTIERANKVFGIEEE